MNLTGQRQQKQEQKLLLQTRPELKKGLNLVKKPGNQPIFQALAGSELEGRNAKAVWIDSGNEASTYALNQHGGPRILEKVKIGRAFTAFQHHSLVQQLEESIEPETELLILPNITYFYCEGQLADWEAEELFRETWQKVKELQEKYNLKVAVSKHCEQPEIPYYISPDCPHQIEVETTRKGLKYDSEEYEQLIYRENQAIQTTMPFWNRKTSDKTKIEAKVKN